MRLRKRVAEKSNRMTKRTCFSIFAEDDMNSYGWGDGIEEWKSDITGKNWKRINDLTPKPNHRYQNIQFVSSAYGDIADDMLLFYGWTPTTKNGVGYFSQTAVAFQ